MTCIIIDDEPRAIAVLERYVNKTDNVDVLACFEKPAAALSFLSGQKPDCIFMDINMPDLDGLQLSRLIGQIPVVFTTAYPQYALESYELNAADYLVKPITYLRFLMCVEKLQAITARH